MTERYLPYFAEQQVDSALRRGHFRHARRLAREAIETLTSEESRIKIDHFFRLKEIAMPFYKARHELFRDGEISEKTLHDAEAAHGDSIELIRANLEKYRDAKGTEKQHYKGAVAEDVIFALGSRSFNMYGRRFMVPTSANDNMRSDNPKDFDVIWLPAPDNNYELRVTPIQVKSDLQAPHNKNTQESRIPAVGVRQIDYASRLLSRYRIEDDQALPGQLIREIDATSTYKDIERLDWATRELYDSIYRPSAAA